MSRKFRFVVDTNVLVSYALFEHSKPWEAVTQALRQGVFLFSDDTVAELNEVLSRAKLDIYVSRSTRRRFLKKWIERAEYIDVTEHIFDCRDPKDDKYLELAVSGKADCIITGDKDLLVLHPFRNISILNSDTFLSEFSFP